MKTKFRIAIVAAALGALVTASCQKAGETVAPAKEYDVDVSAGSGAMYDIEIVGVDDGATKAVHDVKLGTADLGDKHSETLFARLKEKTVNGDWVYVKEGDREFKWVSSATDLATFTKATTGPEQQTLLSAHDNEGISTYKVSATLNGIEVVKPKTYNIEVEDDKRLDWLAFPQKLNKDVDSIGILSSNFTCSEVTIKSNDDSLKIGTSAVPKGNKVIVSFQAGQTARTIYFRYKADSTKVVNVSAFGGGKKADDKGLIVTTPYPVKLKVNCPGYQSGTETAPVWKIDWDKVTANPSYTVTAVYNDGTEKNVQASDKCTVSQTYTKGTAGAGNCFVFDKGMITQASGGNKDTGGNGTVKFTYKENDKTAAVSITVEWWKLYPVSLTNSYTTQYGTDSGSDGVNAKCNMSDGSSYWVSFPNGFTSNATVSDSQKGTIIINTQSKRVFHPLRHGKLTVSDSGLRHRNVSFYGSYTVGGRPCIEGLSSVGYMSGPEYHYVKEEDADGTYTPEYYSNISVGSLSDTYKLSDYAIWDAHAVKGQPVYIVISATAGPFGQSVTQNVTVEQRPN